MRNIVSPLSGIRSPFGGRSDLYKEAGFRPEFVADFGGEYYRANLARSTFAATLTHAATSNATMTDSDGLLKWRPHNLLTYSEDFSNAAWSKNGVTAEASSLTEDTSTGSHRVLNANGISVSAVLHTNAIEVKPNGRTRVRLTNNNLAGSTFDLVGSGSVVSGSGTITSLEDGWYRIYSEIVSTTIERLVLYLDDGTGTSYTGDGVSGVYVRKAHLHRSDLGGMVNNPDRGDSYVPTTSAAVYLPRRGHHIWDGSAWVDEGYLHESEARTNLVTYSNDFTDASWGKTQVSVTAGSIDSPLGALSGSLLTSTTGTACYLRYTTSKATASAYTMSVFAKAGTATIAYLRDLSQVAQPSVYFDLSAGSVETEESGISGEIEDYGNGWYRISATSTSDDPINNDLIDFGFADVDGSRGCSDGKTGYFAGAQLE